MKFPLAPLFLIAAATGAMAQPQPPGNNGQGAPFVLSPFQALGNVIRNPDADPPRDRRRAYPPPTEPAPPPTIIPPGTLANPEAVPQTQAPPPR